MNVLAVISIVLSFLPLIHSTLPAPCCFSYWECSVSAGASYIPQQPDTCGPSGVEYLGASDATTLAFLINSDGSSEPYIMRGDCVRKFLFGSACNPDTVTIRADLHPQFTCDGTTTCIATTETAASTVTLNIDIGPANISMLNCDDCIDPTTCNVTESPLPSICQEITCFGIASTDSSVCSGCGTCVAPDACECNTRSTCVTGSGGLTDMCGPAASCFITGTPVRLANGNQIPIEQVVVGDQVIGEDGSTSTVIFVLTEVTNPTRDIYGINGGPQFFTPEHPWLIYNDSYHFAVADPTVCNNPPYSSVPILQERCVPLEVGMVLMQWDTVSGSYQPVQINEITSTIIGNTLIHTFAAWPDDWTLQSTEPPRLYMNGYDWLAYDDRDLIVPIAAAQELRVRIELDLFPLFQQQWTQLYDATLTENYFCIGTTIGSLIAQQLVVEAATVVPLSVRLTELPPQYDVHIDNAWIQSFHDWLAAGISRRESQSSLYAQTPEILVNAWKKSIIRSSQAAANDYRNWKAKRSNGISSRDPPTELTQLVSTAWVIQLGDAITPAFVWLDYYSYDEGLPFILQLVSQTHSWFEALDFQGAVNACL